MNKKFLMKSQCCSFCRRYSYEEIDHYKIACKQCEVENIFKYLYLRTSQNSINNIQPIYSRYDEKIVSYY